MCTENCQLIPLAYARLADLFDNLLNLKTQYPCFDHVMCVRRALRSSGAEHALSPPTKFDEDNFPTPLPGWKLAL